MLETWRWFGPTDPVSLENIVQAGASGVVTSLHDIATGDVWPLESIKERKALVESAGLRWSVVESVPLHNDIKTRTGNYQRHIDNYQATLRHLGEAGVHTVCYNFMPVVDWTRTNLMYPLANASFALRFDMVDFAAYDVFVLERRDAKEDYEAELLAEAEQRFNGFSEQQIRLLEKNIIAGLPGGEGSYSRQSLRTAIGEFITLGVEGLRENLLAFLRDVVPVAEVAGVKMCIHPDDPPFSLFGLPRVVSTAADTRAILAAVPSEANGLTLCAGSFGARADNDLPAMVREFGSHIHFVHFRNVKRESNGSFYEAEHLGGDTNMVALISACLEEENRRSDDGRLDSQIPMRPDHGHLLGNEIGQAGVNPGYSFAGRMKGMAELRGVLHTLENLSRA